MVRLAFSLKRYDHVSDYYKQLNWLPLDQFIKFRSICSMYKQFHQRCCIPLEPPIQFGQSHSHYTRTSSSFARIVRYELNFSQKLFRYRVTQWWNSLPSQFANLPFNTFVNAVRSYFEHCDTLGSYLIFVVFMICMLCCNLYMYVMLCCVCCVVYIMCMLCCI